MLPRAKRLETAYKVTPTRRGEITFAVNDLVSFAWYDERPLPGGRIGFRQMAPLIGEYANLRVTTP